MHYRSESWLGSSLRRQRRSLVLSVRLYSTHGLPLSTRQLVLGANGRACVAPMIAGTLCGVPSLHQPPWCPQNLRENRTWLQPKVLIAVIVLCSFSYLPLLVKLSGCARKCVTCMCNVTSLTLFFYTRKCVDV